MSFAINANLFLMQHVWTARQRGIDYAPDNGGPHTHAIARMLYSQAQSWAVGRKADFEDNVPVDGAQTWRDAMASIDDRIRSYCASHVRPPA